MHVLGHYLDMTTGKELPVVMSRVANVEDVYADLVISGQVASIMFNERQASLKSSSSRPVVLEFTENPAYTTAFREMMSDVFDGPRVIPVAIMIGVSSSYPCEMIPVSELRSTWAKS